MGDGGLPVRASHPQGASPHREEGASSSRAGRAWGAAWRAALGLAIFGLAFSQVEPRALGGALAAARPASLALGFLSALLGLVLIRALKFWLILHLEGIRLSGPHALWLGTVSHFFGFVLPGTLGSDAWRVYYLARRSRKADLALVAVVVDRVTGVIGQMANVLLASLFLGGMVLETGLLAAGALVSGAAIALTASLGSQRVVGGLRRLPLLRHPRVGHHLSEIQEGFSLFRRFPLGSLAVLFLSTLAHLLWALSIFVVGQDVGLSFLYFWSLIPLADLLASLPLTPSGLGVRDMAYVTLFGRLGVASERMLALSLTALGFLLLTRLLGGLLYLLPSPFHHRDLGLVRRHARTNASP